jgi:hypothetical protein
VLCTVQVDQRLDHRLRTPGRRKEHRVRRVRKPLGLSFDLDQVRVASDRSERVAAVRLDPCDRVLATQPRGHGVPALGSV